MRVRVLSGSLKGTQASVTEQSTINGTLYYRVDYDRCEAIEWRPATDFEPVDPPDGGLDRLN